MVLNHAPLPLAARLFPPLAQGLWGNRLLVGVVLSAAAITVCHYGTSMELATLHNLLRRLYYLPIGVAAVAYGVRGGLLTAFLCSLAYAPHAFLLDHVHMVSGAHAGHDVGMHAGHVMGFAVAGDPSPFSEKVLEILLYHGAGWLTGTLSERWARALSESRTVTLQLREALNERDAMRAQLVRTEKLGALGQLSAGLAHEIRNPLSSIRGSAEILAEDHPQGTPKARMVAIMLKELGRLDQVLTEFLQFARPPIPQPCSFDVAALAAEVAVMTETARAQSHVELTTMQADGVPACWADPNHVRQILLNMVLNATQAMPGGGTIHILAQHAELRGRDMVQVRVTDSGPGISAANLSRVFEPYFTTRNMGTGLGLSISHSLAEANNGALDVASEPGKGTTFTIMLPTRTEA